MDKEYLEMEYRMCKNKAEMGCGSALFGIVVALIIVLIIKWLGG
jgi:hypothetical protein